MGQVERPKDAAANAGALPEEETGDRPSGERRVAREPTQGRRMGTYPAARADSDIRADLDARLAAVDEFDPEEAELVVRDGIVLMLGSVADHGVKRRLEDLAASVRGVREIHDQLQIGGDARAVNADGLNMAEPRAGARTPES